MARRAEKPEVNNPVRQHTVPKFYLKRFSAEPWKKNPSLSVIDIENGEETTAGAASTSVIRHFYTMNIDGEEDYSLEHGMGQIENRSANVLQKLENNTWPLSAEDRLTIAMFISLMMLRGRSSRDLINQSLTQLAAMSFDEAKRHYSEEYGQNIDQHQYNVIIELIGRSKTDPAAAAELHAPAIHGLIPSVSGYLLHRPWSLLNFKNTSLITGDQPVGFSIHRTGLFGPAVSSRATFPLTSTKAIVMGGLEDRPNPIEGKWDVTKDGTFDEAEQINEETARFSSWQLYCTPGSEELVRRIGSDVLADRWVMRPDILRPREN